jgi:hypothetical protein
MQNFTVTVVFILGILTAGLFAAVCVGILVFNNLLKEDQQDSLDSQKMCV